MTSSFEHQGYLSCQRLAEKAATEIASHLREGWTERQAADLMDTFLRDHGVRNYFHHPFAWFGERTRFDGIRSYGAFLPSKRRLLPGETFILDVAPISDGFVCDIGYTSSLGENKTLEAAKILLKELRDEIPELFTQGLSGGKIWETIHERIKAHGYDNIHRKYPFSVLGHRVHRAPSGGSFLKAFNFGWQSFWLIGSRGVFSQLLNPTHNGDLKGLWAIEPHIGGQSFGAKFEEILVVDDRGARWLEGERA